MNQKEANYYEDISRNKSVDINTIDKYLDSREGSLLLQKVIRSSSNIKIDNKKEICDDNLENCGLEAKPLDIQKNSSVLTTKKINGATSNIKDSCCLKTPPISNFLDRSVSSQMGNKEMSGFSKFAQEIRSQSMSFIRFSL